MKTLEYPMESATLSKTQWRSIMATILQKALPRAGYVATFPRDLVYGDTDALGLGIKDPYTLQFVKQLKTILAIDHLPVITADLLRGTMEELMLKAGLPGHINDIDWKIVATYVEPCWWLDLLTALEDSGIKIVDDWATLQPKTDDDKFIMSLFIKAGYKGERLRMLNECRLFLRVTMVADITSLDGKWIERWVWDRNSNQEQYSPH
jgi:hypothetical protein